MTEVLDLARVLNALLLELPRHRYAFSSERQLQDGIELVLRQAGFLLRREVRMSAADQPDFMIEPGVALEVKVDGGLSLVTRQLHRYASLARVRSVVLVTTRMQHRQLPAQLCGKTVHVVHLIGSVL